MSWHDDENMRERYGHELEMAFQSRFVCSCGGHFHFIGEVDPGFPDFTCEYCGLLVDVKGGPSKEKTGNVSVSVGPWEDYPDDTLIVTHLICRGWIANYKKNIRVMSKKLSPTHHGRYKKYGNTSFYLVSCSDFRPIAEFGLKVRNGHLR